MSVYKINKTQNIRNNYYININCGSADAEDNTEHLNTEKKPKKLTLFRLYSEYTASKQYEVRETSLHKTEQVLSNHVLPFFSDSRIDLITRSDIQNWKQKIEEKNLCITTKRTIFCEFSAMMNYAVRFGYIPSNPLSFAGNFKDAYASRKNINYYTADEFLKFIQAAKSFAEDIDADKREWDYYVFFNIAFYTGMRKGEIYALKWNDIIGDLLHVQRSIAQKLKGPDRETPPKNKSSYRTLQIPSPLFRVLNEHYARYSSFAGFSKEWRICGGNQCLRDSTVNRRNVKYSEKADIKTIRIHDFRHSHASLLTNEGINIQEIARRLGHSKIEITWNTYSHLYPREEERAVTVLNKVI